LIGPNGAGKSTMFNGISGVDALTSGAVSFRGERVEYLPAREIARRGMSRTFQHVRLLADHECRRECRHWCPLARPQGLSWRRPVHAERAEEARLLHEAAVQIEALWLGRADVRGCRQPATWQATRIVEIARAFAADPCLLLLDEPAAGLRYLEKQALASLLAPPSRAEGIGILLVEHDMDFVMGLADRVLVMEFGRQLAAGLPEEIQRNPAVVEAYLGGVE
jgi:ABC-type branched-subunit amino acid transport system ATPase component